MATTAAEISAELNKRLDDAELIERKYENDPSKMPQEDWDQARKLLGEADMLQDQLNKFNEYEKSRYAIASMREQSRKPAANSIMPYGQVDEIKPGKKISPGTQFTRNREYLELRQSGKLNSNMTKVDLSIAMEEGTSLIEWKALLRGGSSTSGGPFVLEDHRPGYLDILQREINVLDLLPRISTDSDTIEYVQESTFTNAAAFVAEASGFTASSLGGTGIKPESALAYQTVTATVKTLAHWIPVTNRMLADASAIRGIIDGRLLLGLTLTLEAQVITGAGTGEDLTGILNTALNVVSKGTDNQLDALYKGRTLVRTTGHGRPSAYVLNPADWQTIRLARENTASATLGGYIMGPPSMQGPSTLWGLPVVESEAMTAGTGLIGDWGQGVTLFDREQGNVRVGTINDQFIKNMQTLLAELRVAFVTWRPQVFTKVTGL